MIPVPDRDHPCQGGGEEMDTKKILLGVSLVIFVGLLVMVLMGERGARRGKEKVTIEVSPTPEVAIIPTKTQEEKETIKKTKTHEVKIAEGKFEPESLTIKPNDQVKWVNSDTVSHKIDGKDWEGVEIGPGENFTQSFEKEGVYPYSCEFHPKERGEVVVE